MHTYLQLLSTVLGQGQTKADRTGCGTRSIFGYQMRIDLNQGFPLLTTKKVHFKSIAYELLWFLNGETNLQFLRDQKVSIWDEWADTEGNLGPIYGAQWRSWTVANGESIDQLSQLISQLQTRPDSRRLLFSSWNVADLPDESLSPQANVALGKMALAPCHVLAQFYVANRRLSCQVYQRSCDVFLGLPFNIASYALLTHLLAQQCDYQVGELIWTGGDVHLYLNHLALAELQLQRSPRSLAKLALNRRPHSLFEYQYQDFTIVDYQPYPSIPAPIAV
ncbi:MAG: hypothetical protein RL637_1251 [Pseudomonadota bacterium]